MRNAYFNNGENIKNQKVSDMVSDDLHKTIDNNREIKGVKRGFILGLLTAVSLQSLATIGAMLLYM